MSYNNERKTVINKYFDLILFRFNVENILMQFI